MDDRQTGKIIRGEFLASQEELMRRQLTFTLTPEAICTSIFWQAEQTGVTEEQFLAAAETSDRITELVKVSRGGGTASIALADLEDEQGPYTASWVELVAAGVVIYAQYPWRDPAAEDAFSKVAALVGARASRELVVSW